MGDRMSCAHHGELPWGINSQFPGETLSPVPGPPQTAAQLERNEENPGKMRGGSDMPGTGTHVLADSGHALPHPSFNFSPFQWPSPPPRGVGPDGRPSCSLTLWPWSGSRSSSLTRCVTKNRPTISGSSGDGRNACV